MSELFFVVKPEQFFYCLTVLAVAGFVQGTFGLGFAMIATPLLALTLDYRGAVFLAAVPLLFLAVSYLIVQWRQIISERLSKGIAPGLILGSFLGVWAQTSLPQYAALGLLAILLAASAALPTLVEHSLTMQRTFAKTPPIAFGTLAGLTDTALNVGAPIIVLYGGINKLSRLQQLLALNLCFAIGKTIQISLTATAMLPPVTVAYLVWGIVASVAAYVAGTRLAGRFSEDGFRHALNLFLYLMACVIGYRAIAQAIHLYFSVQKS
jgi:uncharacterized protein